ncbi:hypothetical protein ABK040_015662 [Willaertia magna]
MDDLWGQVLITEEQITVFKEVQDILVRNHKRKDEPSYQFGTTEEPDTLSLLLRDDKKVFDNIRFVATQQHEKYEFFYELIKELLCFAKQQQQIAKELLEEKTRLTEECDKLKETIYNFQQQQLRAKKEKILGHTGITPHPSSSNLQNIQNTAIPNTYFSATNQPMVVSALNTSTSAFKFPASAPTPLDTKPLIQLPSLQSSILTTNNRVNGEVKTSNISALTGKELLTTKKIISPQKVMQFSHQQQSPTNKTVNQDSIIYRTKPNLYENNQISPTKNMPPPNIMVRRPSLPFIYTPENIEKVTPNNNNNNLNLQHQQLIRLRRNSIAPENVVTSPPENFFRWTSFSQLKDLQKGNNDPK